MKVKICGITNRDDALLCEKYGADALGFIFYPHSKRYVHPNSVQSIITSLSPFTNKVGVFVNEKSDTINCIAKELKLNFVQLHGDENEEVIRQIDYPTIKVKRIKSKSDFDNFILPRNYSLLLDTYATDEYGGTGNKFNWSIIPVAVASQIILSGGIGTDDLEIIFDKVKPAAIDLSSSLEKEAGQKDETKLKLFFEKYNQLRSCKC